MPEPAVAESAEWDELLPVLDEELSRLPDNYRAVVVLCDLEGKTRKEAARQLGVAEGTVAGRVARARVMLANRLTQRGVTLSGGALATMLSQNVASACVPNMVVSSTIKAAGLFATGQAGATGAIPVKVAALTDGVLKAMLFTKLKSVTATVLLVAALIGGTGLIYATQGGEEPTKQTKKAKTSPTGTVLFGDGVAGGGIVIDVSRSMEDGGKRDGIKIDVSKSVADGIKRDGAEGEKSKSDRQRLQGTWLVHTVEIDGKNVPKDEIKKAVKMTFNGDEVATVSSSGEESKGVYKIDPEKSPKTLDVTMKGGKTTRLIYKLEDGNLTICEGGGKDRPTEFTSKDAAVIVLKRATAR